MFVSVVAGRTNHMEADQRISANAKTPNFHLPSGVKIEDLSTLVVEVGILQDWDKIGGLDEKAKKWLSLRNRLGITVYPLCENSS
jgi:hypothetical protein